MWPCGRCKRVQSSQDWVEVSHRRGLGRGAIVMRKEVGSQAFFGRWRLESRARTSDGGALLDDRTTHRLRRAGRPTFPLRRFASALPPRRFRFRARSSRGCRRARRRSDGFLLFQRHRLRAGSSECVLEQAVGRFAHGYRVSLTCSSRRVHMASIAQLVEHALRKRMVVGLIPTGGLG